MSRPHARALVAGDTAYSYRDLDRAVSRMARLLLGLGPCQRIAVILPNSFEWVVACFAIARIGSTLVPLNPAFTDREFEYILHDCAADTILCRQELVDRITALRPALPALRTIIPVASAAALEELLNSASAQPLPPAARSEPIQSILYTSGTTGRPKGAMVSHRARLFSAEVAIRGFDLTRQSVVNCPIPLFHSGGLGVFLVPTIAAGGTLILPADAGASETVRSVIQWGANVLAVVPTIVRRYLDTPTFIDAARNRGLVFSYGGSPMPASLGDELMAVIPDVQRYQCYAMTEAPLLTLLSPDDHRRAPHSAGRPFPEIEVKLVDDAGEDAPPGTRGQVVTRGAHLFDGYLGRPGSTAQAMRGGWFHTGDLGIADQDGFITLVGRMTDVIVSGGLNVYSREVEDVLHSHPAVDQAAVFPMPHPVWIESVTAAIVLRPGHTLSAEALSAFCGEHLAPYKRPRQFCFVARFPTTPLGKVRKFELRDMLIATTQSAESHQAARLAASAPCPPSNV